MKSSFKQKIICTSCLLFLAVGHGESQLLKKLAGKLGQEEVKESEQDKKNGNPQDDLLVGEGENDFLRLLGGANEYQAPEQYSFDFQVTMKMGMNKGKTMTQVWKYNTNEGYFGMESEGMLLIHDLESGTMVTINPKNRTFHAMDTKAMGGLGLAMEEEEPEKTPDMVKTNETKMILGYRATKYIMEDEAMSGEFWMAPEVPFDQEFMAKSVSSFGKGPAALPEKMMGFMMEMKGYDKKSRTTTNLEVVQLGPINEVIPMKQYKNAMKF